MISGENINAETKYFKRARAELLAALQLKVTVNHPCCTSTFGLAAKNPPMAEA